MPVAQNITADASTAELAASSMLPSPAGTEMATAIGSLVGLGAADGVTWVRALCTLIPTAGLPVRHDGRRRSFTVVRAPYVPPPSLPPACLQLLHLALGTCLLCVPVARAAASARVWLTCACCWCPCDSGTGGATFKSQNQEWPFPGVSLFTYLGDSAMHGCPVGVRPCRAAHAFGALVCAEIDGKCSV